MRSVSSFLGVLGLCFFWVNLLFMLAVNQQKAPKKINEYYLTDIAKDTFKDAFNDIQNNLKGISGADDLLSGG